MKGIILATTFFVLTMGLSLGFMYWVSADEIRYSSQFILKQAMTETLESLAKLPISQRQDQLETEIHMDFTLRKPEDTQFRIDVLGFSSYPLGLHVVLWVKPNYRPENQWFRFEETLIEVRDDY